MLFGEWSPLCSDSEGVIKMCRSAGGDEDAVEQSTESVECFFAGVIVIADGKVDDTSLKARMPRPSTPLLDLSSDEVAAADGALDSPLSDGDGFFFLSTDEAMLMRRSSAVVMDPDSVCVLDPGLRDRSDGYGDDVPEGVDGW
jgi:hypothetical protein